MSGMDVPALLRRLGLDPDKALPGVYDGTFRAGEGGLLESHTPADGSLLGTVAMATRADYEQVVERGIEVFQRWRMLPAPQRGEIVRQIGKGLAVSRQPPDGTVDTDAASP